MPIAGVVILTDPQQTMDVLNRLNNMEHITTYGVHKDYYIVAVFEADSPAELEKVSKQVTEEVPGILGVYPSYVTFEDVE